MSNDRIHIPAEGLLECPACGLPAEMTDCFTLGGSPEPVEHVKLVCVMRHWFTIPSTNSRDRRVSQAQRKPVPAGISVSGLVGSVGSSLGAL